MPLAAVIDQCVKYQFFILKNLFIHLKIHLNVGRRLKILGTTTKLI